MPDPLEHLRSALADRYTIERELGRGGNAVVYLAHDRKHDRQVALKVLLPELAASVRSERFLREIQIAARLSHPNILAVHDSGEANGALYYVMPYVEGESLRDRLKREKQLPVNDALAITREVASALGYAHSQGVIHRDIKPENIMVAHGKPLVMDFGIARALTAAGGQTVTETGIAVGTPAYMSPEQASGSGELDARSDIYSLGCVLYEMLAGHPPYAGATAQEVLARHALDPVPSLRAARPDVSEAVERCVTQALAKVPVARFATAAEFAAALVAPAVAPPPRRRSLGYVAAGLILLAGSSVVAARSLLDRTAAAPAAASVAVLPFVNLSADTANEYFGDGITEELINALVQVEGLHVPARTSSFAFKGKNPDIREIGRALNVAHVLEGSVRKEGDSIRVTAQLIKVADGYHVWSATYHRALGGALRLQEELARAIVGALEVRLPGPDMTSAGRSTSNSEAYDLYLRGRYFWNRRQREDNSKAIDYFRRAIALDSGYALAYSGLSDAYASAGYAGYLDRDEAYPQAKTAALRALALDETLAEAHSSLARVYQIYDWNLRAADQEYRRAIALNPRYALARAFYATFLARGLGQPDDAVRHAAVAHDLDPLSPVNNNVIAVAMVAARRYDEAIAYARSAVELAPDWATAHQNLARSYRWKGMYQEALDELEIVARLGGRNVSVDRGIIYAHTGRRRDALSILKELEERSRRENAWAPLARLYVALGHVDRAFHALDSALATRAWNNEPPLAGHPDWDPLRSDPRFPRLLTRIGLPL